MTDPDAPRTPISSPDKPFPGDRYPVDTPVVVFPPRGTRIGSNVFSTGEGFRGVVVTPENRQLVSFSPTTFPITDVAYVEVRTAVPSPGDPYAPLFRDGQGAIVRVPVDRLWPIDPEPHLPRAQAQANRHYAERASRGGAASEMPDRATVLREGGVLREVKALAASTAFTVVAVVEYVPARGVTPDVDDRGYCNVWGTIRLGDVEVWRTAGSNGYDTYGVTDEVIWAAHDKATAHLHNAMRRMLRSQPW